VQSFIIQVVPDCSGDKENINWQLREIDRTFAHSDLPGASLLSGRHLSLQGQAIRNDYSKLAAAGDVHIQAERLLAVALLSAIPS